MFNGSKYAEGTALCSQKSVVSLPISPAPSESFFLLLLPTLLPGILSSWSTSLTLATFFVMSSTSVDPFVWWRLFSPIIAIILAIFATFPNSLIIDLIASFCPWPEEAVSKFSKSFLNLKVFFIAEFDIASQKPGEL